MPAIPKDYPVNRLIYWLRGARRSLTIWFNSVAGTMIAALPYAQDALPQLAQYIGPQTYKIMAAVIVLGNIILRAKTSTALPDKGQ